MDKFGVVIAVCGHRMSPSGPNFSGIPTTVIWEL